MESNSLFKMVRFPHENHMRTKLRKINLVSVDYEKGNIKEKQLQ